MAKISKPTTAKHEEAMALVRSGEKLGYDQRWFVAENFREDANHLNGKAGAFFTPTALANDFCMGVNYGDGLSRIIDLCAGIGKLSLPVYERLTDKTRLTLVESNPDYVAVGRKIMPEATWICADVMDTQQWWDGLLFDLAIANPPFGAIGCKPHAMSLFKNKGLFEFNVVELAAMIAKDAAFILPQRSVPFRYSGQSGMQEQDNPRFKQFHNKTGIGLEILISVDTNDYIDDWNGVSPLVELVSFPEEEHQHFYHNPRFEASHADKPGSDEAPPFPAVSELGIDSGVVQLSLLSV